MSYTVKTTITKPAESKWFGEVHPALAKKFERVDRARAVGVQSRNVEQIDDNTVVVTVVWDDESSYRSFLTKRGASVADAVRGEHNRNNNITAQVEVV